MGVRRWEWLAALGATVVMIWAGAAGAQTIFTMDKAPPGLKALIEANRDKPGVADGCMMLDDAKGADAVAALYPLDGDRSLLIVDCMRTMKFNVQRAFVVTGDDFAAAARAALPVRRQVDPSGVTSDSMSLAFDAKSRRLTSDAWEGASCWSKRVWAWKQERFVLVSDRKAETC
jgi:hypothetical protein